LRIPAGGVASVRARLAERGIENYIVVAPGGSWRAKCKPVVIQGPGERTLVEEVCCAAAPSTPLVMATSIEELMALLARARCVVAVDSGPLHLAAAMGAPVVGLYGPTDPARNGPFVPGAVVVSEARPEEISYKRRLSYSPAMLRITVDRVLAAVNRTIKATA
jgi:heptosyltransferase-1